MDRRTTRRRSRPPPVRRGQHPARVPAAGARRTRRVGSRPEERALGESELFDRLAVARQRAAEAANPDGGPEWLRPRRRRQTSRKGSSGSGSSAKAASSRKSSGSSKSSGSAKAASSRKSSGSSKSRRQARAAKSLELVARVLGNRITDRHRSRGGPAAPGAHRAVRSRRCSESRRTGSEWSVTVEVLELERVPNTTDVLGNYEVTARRARARSSGSADAALPTRPSPGRTEMADDPTPRLENRRATAPSRMDDRRRVPAARRTSPTSSSGSWTRASSSRATSRSTCSTSSS